MSVNITELSSDELFQLAQKKRQQEAERAEARDTAIRQLKQQRAQLVAEHAKALEAVDYQIRDLHNKRAQLVIRHKSAVDTLDKQLADLAQEAKTDQISPPPSRPSADRPALSADTLHATIVELMHGRAYLSESLLKEKLRGKGLDVSQLGKYLDQLTRAGSIVSRGGGNYALGKKR